MLIYQRVTKEAINQIQELWELNRLYHEINSTHFGHQYRGLSFAKRMEDLLALPEDSIRLTLAINDTKTIGYCLSTIKDKAGELLSIHVHEAYRGKGIGQVLVKDHLNWFNESQCTTISVHVDCSNESTIAFYSKLGFYPNTMVMQQLPKE